MSKSKELFERAQKVIPGGVNSPVRAFRSVGGTPLFIHKAKGAYLYDEDGRSYIDYVGSWGPMIVGHSHPEVIEAVRRQLESGLSYGAPTEKEVKMAETLCRLVPSVEMVRMVSSGTEATMSAIRLARGFTGRSHLLKFEGCYHGHSDSLLVKAGSGALTMGVPSSAGIPNELAKLTLTSSYNDILALKSIFNTLGSQLACVIVEPIAGNMNCVMPQRSFMAALKELCEQYGTLLIFDEVMTGFRVALGGAQSLLGVKPDLTTFGKIIGGGMSVGAFGGRKDIMEHIAPLGPVYQAGTLSGNPLAMAAGLATLDLIQAPDFYEKLETKAQTLVSGLSSLAKEHGIPFCTSQVGGMFGLFFTEGPIHGFADAMRSDIDKFKAFFHSMLKDGVYFAPSAYEAGFISSCHQETEIEQTLMAAKKAFQSL